MMDYVDFRRATLAFSVAVFGAAVATGQPAVEAHQIYKVADWRDIVPERRVEFQSYRTITISNGEIDDEEKARRISKKFATIQKEVKAERIAAYQGVSTVVGVGNSVTKGSSGGDSKTSDAECRGAPLPNMYTTPAWARGAYKSGSDDANAALFNSGLGVASSDIVAGGGVSVCAIKLKQSGKGRKVSYSEATFRIRPAYISSIVDQEMPRIMNDISKSPL